MYENIPTIIDLRNEWPFISYHALEHLASTIVLFPGRFIRVARLKKSNVIKFRDFLSLSRHLKAVDQERLIVNAFAHQ